MDWLHREIMEQPTVLERLIDIEYPAIVEIAARIRESWPRYVLIAARGTSDNAATYAKYLFGTLNRLPVALAAPSIHTLYGTSPKFRQGLVVAISQSGMSPDIVAVVGDARAQGAPTLVITNAPDSPLARAADWVIACHAGSEKSVAATKTYTASLMALALLSVALSGDSTRLEQIRSVPGSVDVALSLASATAQAAERYRYMASCAIVARGYNYATAFEIALKLKELTYVAANPYSSADFMHGPIAVVESGFPVFLVAPGGPAFPNMLALARELAHRGAELIVVSEQEDALALATTPLPLPDVAEEWLSPLISVVPGQLFAYHLSRAKGIDPERPRGLHKITETR